MLGLNQAFKREFSFRLEILGGLVWIVVIVFAWPLSMYELMAILIVYFLVLIFELFNTALESALERIHPSQHELIGVSKNVAAAAVFLGFSLNGLIAILIVLNRFGIFLLN